MIDKFSIYQGKLTYPQFTLSLANPSMLILVSFGIIVEPTTFSSTFWIETYTRYIIGIKNTVLHDLSFLSTGVL